MAIANNIIVIFKNSAANSNKLIILAITAHLVIFKIIYYKGIYIVLNKSLFLTLREQNTIIFSSRNIIASIVWLSGYNVYITRIERGA
ncbi:hypothetical protein S965_002944 [Salmonella enterica subsp. salamae]|nr:hypothetical protein [Salmonella enterica subsp. salamae]